MTSYIAAGKDGKDESQGKDGIPEGPAGEVLEGQGSAGEVPDPQEKLAATKDPGKTHRVGHLKAGVPGDRPGGPLWLLHPWGVHQHSECPEISSGWWEGEAMMGRSRRATFEALKHIRERKNYHVRKTPGYLRYDTLDELIIINELYREALRLYKNFSSR